MQRPSFQIWSHSEIVGGCEFDTFQTSPPFIAFCIFQVNSLGIFVFFYSKQGENILLVASPGQYFNRERANILLHKNLSMEIL